MKSEPNTFEYHHQEDDNLKPFWPRSIWRYFILYNKALIWLLRIYNRIRWIWIDIPVIIWPPASEHFDAIERDIRTRYRVVEAMDCGIDPERFEEFVRKVYDIDSASPKKITYKLANLVRPPLTVRVLTIRFPWPKMEAQDVLNRLRCKDVHALKAIIRADYQERIPNYVFDIIIHSTETATQGTAVKRLLREYGTVVEHPTP